MNRRRVIFIFGSLVLLSGFAYLLWPQSVKTKPYSLNIVRQGTEQGKAVVYFGVEGGDSRQFIISRAEVDYFDLGSDPIRFDWGIGWGDRRYGSNIWALSTPCPMGDPKKGRKEFGILVPTNAAVWKMRAVLITETPISIQGLREMIERWKIVHGRGVSFFKATKDTLHRFYPNAGVEVQSDSITNSVAQH